MTDMDINIRLFDIIGVTGTMVIETDKTDKISAFIRFDP
jgi:hypothetical protein